MEKLPGYQAARSSWLPVQAWPTFSDKPHHLLMAGGASFWGPILSQKKDKTLCLSMFFAIVNHSLSAFAMIVSLSLYIYGLKITWDICLNQHSIWKIILSIGNWHTILIYRCAHYQYLQSLRGKWSTNAISVPQTKALLELWRNAIIDEWWRSSYNAGMRKTACSRAEMKQIC